MTALAFRTGWNETRSIPAYLGEEALSPLATEQARLDDLRSRYFTASAAEMAADPCTEERSLLAKRTIRLARLARAARQRVTFLSGER